ncbi:MAG: hypothetical protein F6K20_19635, partial [Moorea sp. SIO2C4]|nr:hypothetical protein [Moorena sp. SIO2C4]
SSQVSAVRYQPSAYALRARLAFGHAPRTRTAVRYQQSGISSQVSAVSYQPSANQR